MRFRKEFILLAADRQKPKFERVSLDSSYWVLWQCKVPIVLFSVFVSMAFLFASLFVSDTYRATALLSPVQSDRGMGMLEGQFGGLASLVGVDIGGTGNKVHETIAIMKSRDFINRFIEAHDLYFSLFAVKPKKFFDSESGIDESIFNPVTSSWVVDDKQGSTKKPSSWKSYELFSRILAVELDKKTGLVEVSVEWHDPLLAKNWVDWLVKDVNEYLKMMEVAEAERNILFLKKSLENTSIASFQEAFYKLIENQMKTTMLAETREEFALKTLDPAVVAEESIGPRRFVVGVLGFVFGVVLGSFCAYFRVLGLTFFNKNKSW